MASALSLPAGISSDLQKLLRYFPGTATVAFSRIPSSLSGKGRAIVSSNHLALYLKDLKAGLLPIPALKLVASCFE